MFIPKPTFASYTTAMDVQTGVIATQWTSMWEPQRSIVKDARRWRGGEIAPLSQWNDVVFLEWSRLAASSAQQSSSATANSAKVNYIMFNHVISSEDGFGQDVVEAVFESIKSSGNPGPPVSKHKRTFSYSEPRDAQGFQALLGTHAGDLVTKFFSQHKAELGIRRVSDISVFAAGTPQERYDKKRAKPCLLFKIEAAHSVQSEGSTQESTPGLTGGSGPSLQDSTGAVTPVPPGGRSGDLRN
jgi:hypothetical protein